MKFVGRDGRPPLCCHPARSQAGSGGRGHRFCRRNFLIDQTMKAGHLVRRRPRHKRELRFARRKTAPEPERGGNRSALRPQRLPRGLASAGVKGLSHERSIVHEKQISRCRINHVGVRLQHRAPLVRVEIGDIDRSVFKVRSPRRVQEMMPVWQEPRKAMRNLSRCLIGTVTGVTAPPAAGTRRRTPLRSGVNTIIPLWLQDPPRPCRRTT